MTVLERLPSAELKSAPTRNGSAQEEEHSLIPVVLVVAAFIAAVWFFNFTDVGQAWKDWALSLIVTI